MSAPFWQAGKCKPSAGVKVGGYEWHDRTKEHRDAEFPFRTESSVTGICL